MGRLIPAGVFAAVFALYAAAAYPTFAPRDAADMARAAVTAGVAHPPGYPLYALLGRLWLALVPFGDASYRLNLLSAAAGALACALLAAHLLRRGRAAALAGSLALAFSAPLWKFSLLSEKYALHAAFAAALLLLSEGEERARVRREALAGLLFGLGCVNHQTFVLTAPVWLYLYGARSLRSVLPFAALGLLLDLAVPARLGSWSAGWAVLTRAAYGATTLSPLYTKSVSETAGPLLAHLGGGLVFVSSPLLALVALRGLRGAPALGLAFSGAAFFLLSRLDVSTWLPRTILESAFVLPALFLCLAAGESVAALEKRGRGAAWLLAGLLAGWPLAARLRAHSHRDDFSAWDYVRNARRTLPPGSVVEVQGDTARFGLLLTGAPVTLADAGAQLSLGAPSGPGHAPAAPVPWPLYAARPSRALRSGETYARDPALAYAFAHSQEARALEARGQDGTYHALMAAVWDAEDFGVELAPAKNGYNPPNAP